jgi:hypothetical protein
MLADTAWLEYGEQAGAGPRGAVGANFWHLTTIAAIRGDEVAAIASDGLEAVLGGYVGRLSLDYEREPDRGRFRLRVERLAGTDHFLIGHEAIGDPEDQDDPPLPRQWLARPS